MQLVKKYIFFVLLIGLNLYLLIIIFHYNRRQYNIKNTLTQLTYYKDVIADFYKYERTKLVDKKVINENGDSVFISTHIEKEFSFVFEYSASDCSTCVDSTLSIIARNQHKLKNVIILTNKDEAKQFKYIKKKHNLVNAIFLQLPISDNLNEGSYYPKVFLINKNMEITHSFVVSKELLVVFNNYLNLIEKKYY